MMNHNRNRSVAEDLRLLLVGQAVLCAAALAALAVGARLWAALWIGVLLAGDAALLCLLLCDRRY